MNLSKIELEEVDNTCVLSTISKYSVILSCISKILSSIVLQEIVLVIWK